MLLFDQIREENAALRGVAIAILLGFATILAWLWYIQGVASKRFVQDQQGQSYRSVRIPAIRGRILDRNGATLAESQPQYTVSFYFEELRKQFQAAYTNELPRLRLELAAIKDAAERGKVRELRLHQLRYRVVSNAVHRVGALLGLPGTLSEPAFRKHYQEKLALPMPVFPNLTLPQVARFEECPDPPPGCDIEIQPVRTYPAGGAAAHLLGYLIRDELAEEEDMPYSFRLPDYRGVSGLEGLFEPQLRGKAGVKTVLVNNLGYRQTESVWTPERPGCNLELTIDLALQEAAEKALLTESRMGPVLRGAVVVMDVRNGDVLAAVSAPAFQPGGFIPNISHQEWTRLNDPGQRPMLNRVTYAAYAPGSIFKIVTALAALETGVILPAEKLENPGYYQLGSRRIADTAPPGLYDFRRAFKKSSNTYFIHYALMPGVFPRLIELGERLHLGERTGVLPQQEVRGSFPSEESLQAGWHPGDTANLAIGQGAIAVTPLQMAVMTAAVANGGKVYWPRLVRKLVPPESEQAVQFPEARLRDDLQVRPESLRLLHQAMLADVSDTDELGTGRGAYVEGMEIGGKTGTAQVTQGRRVVDHITWFVSFAPVSAPRYAVVVMVESGASGGQTCAPVAGAVYRALQRWEKAPARTFALARHP